MRPRSWCALALALGLSTACGDKSDPGDSGAEGTGSDGGGSGDGGSGDDGCATPWFPDSDGDGFGFDLDMVVACEAPEGHVIEGGDCDDTDAEVNPGASEVCNGGDDDCDGLVDDADDSLDAATADTWYTDGDGDGWGDEDVTVLACEAPEGTVAEAGDCDDAEAEVHPGASEVCSGRDEDCDGLVDDADDSLELSSAETWSWDGDGDGYGDDDVTAVACVAPSEHVAEGGDCDDTDAGVFPGADEVCNEVDDDCDGDVDDADPSVDSSTFTTWYEDADADGYGTSDRSRAACAAPSGAVDRDGDCDDADAAVNPGATEVCSGVDDDCDGDVDDDDPSVDTSTFTTWYADTDGDGYGDSASSAASCAAPSGHVDQDGDCDDADADISPGATEECGDGEDDDCDGLADCEDGDCLTSCTEQDCADGLDDDGDGDADCADSDCLGGSDCPVTLVSARVTGGQGQGASYQADRYWPYPSHTGWRSYERHTFTSVTGTLQGLGPSSSTFSCSWQVGRVSWTSAADNTWIWLSGHYDSDKPEPVRSGFQVSSGCLLTTSAWLPASPRGGRFGTVDLVNSSSYPLVSGWYTPASWTATSWASTTTAHTSADSTRYDWRSWTVLALDSGETWSP